MDKVVTSLVDVIKEEEGLLSEFLDLLEEQKKILVENDMDEFERTAILQEELIEKIEKLENERVSTVRKVANGTHLPESDITLTRLVEMSLGHVSDELADAKKNLGGLVNRIKKINQVNQYLIKRSFNRSQRTINWMIDDAQLEVTYENNGKIRNRNTNAVLLNKTY